jgi:hypothetical protein
MKAELRAIIMRVGLRVIVAELTKLSDNALSRSELSGVAGDWEAAGYFEQVSECIEEAIPKLHAAICNLPDDLIRREEKLDDLITRELDQE